MKNFCIWLLIALAQSSRQREIKMRVLEKSANELVSAQHKLRAKLKSKKETSYDLATTIPSDWKKYWQLREELLSNPIRQNMAVVFSKALAYLGEMGYTIQKLDAETKEEITTEAMVEGLNAFFIK